jgi:chloramphenicol O-acetyltransferase type A
MFEWPIASRINLDTYPRRMLYEHFLTFEIPVATRTIQIDVTSLLDYIKSNDYRFSLTLGFIITRATNHVPELRHRIQDGHLVEFNKIIPSFTILSKDKLVYFSKGVFTDNFDEDYPENLAINENAAKGLDQNVGSENQGQIFITNNPWNSFTALQFPYSKKVESIPVFGIGKIYQDGNSLKAPLAIQNHHSLTDGYHIGHFLDILDRHLKDPSLVRRPFTSDFR